MSRVFLPQSVLEQWTISEQADVRGALLEIKGQSAAYPVEDAHFFKLLVSGPDEHKLVRKVKTQAQLTQLGAEVMSGSAIAGESAYDVVSGYVVQIPDEAPQAIPPKGAKADSGETDLLAKFLLDKL